MRALLPTLKVHSHSKHLTTARAQYESWCTAQHRLADPDPDHDHTFLGRLRRHADNPQARIRPEALAAALDRHAPEDTVFTSDTGMSTVWLSRFITMAGRRQLLGSYNLGSMANALPQALGAQALDRDRHVVALSGDGGLMMLLGDLRTAVSYNLPITVVVFDNGRLGMVKLEQEEGGLPEFGTVLDNPDLAAVAAALGLTARRITDPNDLNTALREALAERSPTLLDVRTNPNEIAVPPTLSVEQAWGFAVAKIKESIVSRD